MEGCGNIKNPYTLQFSYIPPQFIERKLVTNAIINDISKKTENARVDIDQKKRENIHNEYFLSFLKGLSMKSFLYLLNMSITGIKNIEKEITLDFYGKNVDKNFDPSKYCIKGIYGENGVGKSALVTAVDIVKNFAVDNNYLAQNQAMLKNLLNKKTKRFRFRCEFVSSFSNSLDIYEYEVILKSDNNDNTWVEHESLKVKRNNSKNKSKILFVSEGGRFVSLGEEGDIADQIRDRTQNLLNAQSAISLILSIFTKENIRTEFSRDIAGAILFFFIIDTYFDREDKHMDFYQNLKIQELQEKNATSEEILEEIYGRTVSNIRRVAVKSFGMYEKKIKKLERFIKLFKPDLKKIDIDKKINGDFLECELVMDYGAYKVNREFESTGIKKLIELFSALQSASAGAIVFIDELDSNINDVYLCRMIEYFKYYGKGQICFTCHNLDPMSVLRNNNKSIDFLVSDNRIIPWVKNGHYTPDNSYRNGMIEGMPYNIDPIDFIGIFEGDE